MAGQGNQGDLGFLFLGLDLQSPVVCRTVRWLQDTAPTSAMSKLWGSETRTHA